MLNLFQAAAGRVMSGVRVLLTVVVALMALGAPSAAFALSPGCIAINALGGPFTVDGVGNGTDKFTDFATQPLANGEVVTYSWSGNTKGAYVYILYSQNGGAVYAPESVENATAVSGSGTLTFSNTSAGDFFEVGVDDDTLYKESSNPAARNSNVNITLTCAAPATPPTVNAIFNASSVNLGDSRQLQITITNPTASAMTGVSLAAAALPTNLDGSAPSTTCPGATVAYNAGTRAFSLSGGSLAAGASCLSTLTVTPTAAGSYAYTTGAVSATGATGGTATTGALVVNAVPTVTSISPTAGPIGGGASVTLTGTNFTGVTGAGGVKFGGTNATSYTVVNGATIIATAPAGSEGTVDITVTNGGGTSATSASDRYTYVAAPTVTSISPTSGPSAGGTTVTITGTGFSGATGVTFGGTAASGFTVVSATQITATSPAGTGTVDVRVTTSGGTSATSASDQFTYVAPPTVTAVSPNSGPSVGGTTVTIMGTGFTGATGVTFGGTAATGITVVNATRITATSPAGTGTVDVRVTTPGGTSATSASDQFTYVAAPTVTAVSPNSGPSVGGTSVIITGTGFSAASPTGAVKFGATTAAYTINSNTQITATSPAGSTGVVDVTVTTLGGTSTTSAADRFNYVAPPTAGNITYGTIIPYNPGSGSATNFSLAANVHGNPTDYAVGSATSAQGGSVSVDSAGMVSYTPPVGYGGANDSFFYTATNLAGTSSPAVVTLTIGNPSLTVSWPSGSGVVGQAYNPGGAPIAVSGGKAPYTIVVSGLPAGLTADAAGVISGVPTATGTFQVTTTITDSSTGAGSFTSTDIRMLTIGAPTIIITPSSLGSGQAGQAYSQSLTASGATGPYAWSVTGALPAGLTLSAEGVLSGTPTQAGAFNFTVSASDSSTGGTFSGSRNYSLSVGGPTLTLDPATLSGMTVGVPYTATISAAGGTGPYQYSTSGTSLPPGLTLAANGELSGTPTAAGNYSFTISARDSTTGTGAPFDIGRSYNVSVAPPAAPTAGAIVASISYGSSGSSIPASLSGGAADSVAVVAQPTHGVATVNGFNFIYTPNAGYYGADSFTYTATNQGGTSTPATVTLTVATPPAPTTSNPAIQAVPYDSAGIAIDLTASVGGVYSSLTVSSAPSHGAASVSGSVVTYVPTAGYFGPDSFTFTATGPGGVSAPATVTLAVATPVAPTASNPAVQAVPYDSTGVVIDLKPSVSGVYSSLAVASGPSHGAVSLSNGVATYVPTAGYFGADSFTFTATGPGGTSAPATVSVVVATPPAPVIEAPTEPTPVPSAPGGGSAPVTVALAPLTEGVLDGYRITAVPQYGSAEVGVASASIQAMSARASAAPAAAPVYQLTYTPAPDFMGTDTVSVVAYGPGGESSPVVFTFQVAGKAPDLSAQVLSNAVVTIKPTAGLRGGPFNALRITRAPGFGAATVQGLDIVFNPGVANGGATSLDYVVDLPFGASAAGRIDLTSNLVPGVQVLTAETIQGRPVTVRISDAVGGPFTGAAVVSVSPSTAGSATIAGSGGVYDLTFTPAGAFSGEVTTVFSLTNAFGTTESRLTITVKARPDPSLDPEVRGVATSQVTTARRFADAQIDNFQRRLQDLHDGGNGSSNGLSLNLGAPSDTDRDPRQALRRQLGQDRNLDPGALSDGRDRDMLGRDLWADRRAEGGVTASDRRNASTRPGGDAVQADGKLGFWTAGSVDWGRQKADGQRDSRFTTQGVTAGLDVRLSDRLILGAGLGYGEDKSRIGDQGSVSRGEAVTGALYASWRPVEDYYLDGVLGLSQLDFASRRRVSGLAGQADGYADGERSGDVRFVSAAFGRITRGDGLIHDLYARVEARDIVLDGFTETGGGLAALIWDEVEQKSLSANIGAAWRWNLETRRFGVFRPSARVEWSHEFEDIGTQGVRYADWAASPTYLVPLNAWSRNALNLNLETEWSLSEHLMFSLGYRGMLGDQSTSHGAEIRLKFGW
ncbi:IPT/TIG domain-containing protein [Brevundimonas faecalis]|uniref:IPT/TIG domain-containing protein n=1 Tax=Brevundimonas faecalis TaxID=947378 RepID=UPI0036082FA8